MSGIPLFRWPWVSRTRVVEPSFRLTMPAGGDPATPAAIRTVPFRVSWPKGMDRAEVQAAVEVRAHELGHYLAQVMVTEVMALVDHENSTRLRGSK